MTRLFKFSFIGLFFAALLGCSAFEFFVERAINGFEKKTANRINRYADFDNKQSVMINKLAAEIDDWMRVERLSKVANTLLAFADNVEEQGQLPESNWHEVYQELQRGLLLSEAPHLINGFTELAFTLSDDQAEQVTQKMDERFDKWHDELDERSQKKQNEAAVKNINWLFRAIDRPLKKAEKAEAIRILNEQKVDFAKDLQQSKQRIETVQTLIKGRNSDTLVFHQELQKIWILAELPDTETEPEIAQYNSAVTYRCLTYLLSLLTDENRIEMAFVLRDYAALFAELSES